MAGWSKDPSTRVGAVIADGKHVISVGFNGFPPTTEDKEEWLNDRQTKYSLVIHAEVNAILNAARAVKGSTIYVTLPPCSECAKFIAASGISRVVASAPGEYSNPLRDSFEQAKRIFAINGIRCEEV